VRRLNADKMSLNIRQTHLKNKLHSRTLYDCTRIRRVLTVCGRKKKKIVDKEVKQT
jgi:hypothetical protein